MPLQSPLQTSILLHHIGFLFGYFSRLFLHQVRSFFASRSVFFVAAFIAAFASTGCVSSHRADAQMLRVLDAEAKLLGSLKEERRHPALLKKLHGDETIAEAEIHLREDIDELIKTNDEMRSTLKNR